MIVSRGVFPYFPRRVAEIEHVCQFLVLLEGVHAPELVGWVADDFLFRDQSLKRLHNQLLARSHVVEDLLSEYEEAGIDANVGFAHALDASYRIVPLELHDMEALGGFRA